MKQNNSKTSAMSFGDNRGRNKLNTLPLRVELIGFFLLFAAVMLVFLWFFQIVFLDDFYRLIKTEQIEKSTDYIYSNINEDNIESVISEVRHGNNMRVAVYDTSSQIFTRVYYAKEEGRLGVDFMPHEIYTCYYEAKTLGGKVIMDDTNLNNKFSESDYAENLKGERPEFDEDINRNLTCARIIPMKNGREYMVVVRSEIVPVNSAIETLRIQLTIVTAVLLFVAFIFALIVSEKIAKPIVRTNEGAKELSRQNYQVTFEGGSCREICELNDTLNIAATELSTVDRLRRELIANISHDLRTPLTMISGYAEVMRDIPGENSPENLQVIIDESQRLSRLVSDLLDMSKLESGSIPLNKEVFSITDCVRDIFTRYRKLQGEEGYSLEFLHEGIAYVRGDEGRLTQVIYNLVNNAINYSGDEKKVTVRQSIKDNKVRIEVIDRGEGIAPEDLKYIWDRYYRVDREHRSAVVGSGLGLSIVKNILVLHNARFGVRSTVGRGSVFWFELPAERYEEQKALPSDTVQNI